MTFATATVGPADFVGAIVNAMISTAEGHWQDGDTGVTTAASPYGRVLKYNVSGEELYIAFMITEWGHSSSSCNSSGGILVFVSSGWDSGNHCPSGTVKLMQIPFYSFRNSHSQTSRLGSASVQYWMWYEDEILTLGWQTATGSSYNCVGIFTLQHDTLKEFTESATNFYLYSTYQYGTYSNAIDTIGYTCGAYPYAWLLPSAWNTYKGSSSYLINRYVHPFTAGLPASAVTINYGNSASGLNFQDGYEESYNMLIVPTRARKSDGNSKVYMAFPVVVADNTTDFKSPLTTLKGFFPVYPGRGIADGDLINVPVSWEGGEAETWQYVYKSLISPQGGQIDVAIKYAEV